MAIQRVVGMKSMGMSNVVLNCKGILIGKLNK